MYRRVLVGEGDAGRSDGARSLGALTRLAWEVGGGLDRGGLGVEASCL